MKTGRSALRIEYSMRRQTRPLEFAKQRGIRFSKPTVSFLGVRHCCTKDIWRDEHRAMSRNGSVWRTGKGLGTGSSDFFATSAADRLWASLSGIPAARREISVAILGNRAIAFGCCVGGEEKGGQIP